MADDQFDIYISYAPEDEDRVRRIVEELEWVGLKVWFRNQPATSQESLQMMRQRINNSTCQVMVWTKNSAGSGRMQAEGREGSFLRRNIAVRLDSGLIPPKGTDALFYADLSDWHGGTDHRGMKKLLGGIWSLIGKGQQPDQVETQADSTPRANNEFGASASNEALTPEQKDERAWQTCLTYNNRTYFEHYLRFFPNGRYAAEAQERLAKKKRTTTIVITCAVIYIIVQILASVFVNFDRF
jgi:hypothetical protein